MNQRQNNHITIKISILVVAITLLSVNLIKAQGDVKITWNYDGLTFKQFVAAAEEKTDVRFFFRDDWVQELKPGDFPGMTSLVELFEKMFNGKFLYFYRDGNGDFIITKNVEIEHIDKTGAERNSFVLEEYSLEQEKQKNSESVQYRYR